MKKLLTIMLGVILVCHTYIMTSYARPDWPSDTGIQAQGGIVIDVDSGTALFGQNIHNPYPPASITKLLTALVVLENSKLEDLVTFSDDAVNNIEAGSGNRINVTVGDQLTVEDCLYAMLLVSSNQAANALAEHVAGSRDAFVQMMNDKIAEIGCTESQFANPSGLNDEKQYTTAYDMSLIARAAFQNSKLLEINSALSHKLAPTSNNPEGLTIKMEHRLLNADDPSSNYYCEGAAAGKTGYTSKAGNTLVTYAERGGRKLISVILKGTQPQYYMDGKELLEFGFTRFKNMNIAENETAYITGEQPLTLGSQSYQPSELFIDPSGVITLPNDASFADADMELITSMPGDCPDTAIALIQYTYNERKVGQAYLQLKEKKSTKENETKTDHAESEKGQEAGKGNHISVFAIVLPVIFILAASMGGYLYLRKKKEQRERDLRRMRRRKRLLKEGCTEEEFNRMLKERMRPKRKNLKR